MRSFVLSGLATLLPLASTVSAQSASYSYLGQGCRCTIWEGVPFTVTGLPRLGKSISITTLADNATSLYSVGTVLLTGSSNARWGALTLPFDPQHVPCGNNCGWCGKLLVSPDSLLVLPGVTGTGASCLANFIRTSKTFQLSIPNDARLLGMSFYQQILMDLRVHVGPGLRTLAFSRGGHGVIGR